MQKPSRSYPKNSIIFDTAYARYILEKKKVGRVSSLICQSLARQMAMERQTITEAELKVLGRKRAILR